MKNEARFQEQKAVALSRVRSWNVWLVLQPSGNVYLTDKMRDADTAHGEVVLGVVRRGTSVYEPAVPRAWKRAPQKELAPICQKPRNIEALCRASGARGNS